MVYWNHSPTPYFVERFNAVVERGGLEFEAWFNDRREPSRSWDVNEADWLFPARYIPPRSLLGWSERVPAAELRATRPDVLVQEYDRSHLTAGFLVGRALAHRCAFRVLPNFDAWSERTWWREAGKRFVFRAVDAAKVPGEDGAALAEHYGLDAARIARVTQSVDVERLAAARLASAPERGRRREQLGLSGCVFIYVGRLWSGKGTDGLLDAYESLATGGREVSLLMLGDGPDEQRYRARAARLPRVVFAGFVQPREIAAHYALADVMVFPTLGDPHGLVVEEAMVAGLPVICTSAAGDIAARLPDGEAGFVVAPGDTAALERRMRQLVEEPARRRAMGARAAALGSTREHQRYAEEFEAFIAATLEHRARRGAAALSARAAGHALSLFASAHACAPPIGPHDGRPVLQSSSDTAATL